MDESERAAIEQYKRLYLGKQEWDRIRFPAPDEESANEYLLKAMYLLLGKKPGKLAVASLRNADAVVEKLSKGEDLAGQEIEKWKYKYPHLEFETEVQNIPGITLDGVSQMRKFLKNALNKKFPADAIKSKIDPALAKTARKLFSGIFFGGKAGRENLTSAIKRLKELQHVLINRGAGIEVSGEIMPSAFFDHNPEVIVSPSKPTMDKIKEALGGSLAIPFHSSDLPGRSEGIAFGQSCPTKLWSPEIKMWENAPEIRLMQSSIKHSDLPTKIQKKIKAWPRTIIFWNILSAMNRGFPKVVIRSDQWNLATERMKGKARKFICEEMPKKPGFKTKVVGVPLPGVRKLRGAKIIETLEGSEKAGLMGPPVLDRNNMPSHVQKGSFTPPGNAEVGLCR